MSPRIAIVIGALFAPVVTVGLWAALRAPTPPAATASPSPAAAPSPTAEAAHGPSMTASPSSGRPANTEGEIELPPEPDGPERGTAAHAEYFEAVVAGEERGLASVREALAAARAGESTDSVALRRLSALEKTYVERLERHRKELAKK